MCSSELLKAVDVMYKIYFPICEIAHIYSTSWFYLKWLCPSIDIKFYVSDSIQEELKILWLPNAIVWKLKSEIVIYEVTEIHKYTHFKFDPSFCDRVKKSIYTGSKISKKKYVPF